MVIPIEEHGSVISFLWLQPRDLNKSALQTAGLLRDVHACTSRKLNHVLTEQYKKFRGIFSTFFEDVYFPVPYMRHMGGTPESPKLVKKIQLSLSKPNILRNYNDVTIHMHKDSYKLEWKGSTITTLLEFGISMLLIPRGRPFLALALVSITGIWRIGIWGWINAPMGLLRL
jgi:hypothetical protein